MALVLRWKLTAAMAVVYVAVAAAVVYLADDPNLGAAALVVLFALVLLAGNMYVRAKEKAQGAPRASEARLGRDDRPRAGHLRRRTAQGGRGGPAGPATLRPAPRPMTPDPEAGRR